MCRVFSYNHLLFFVLIIILLFAGSVGISHFISDIGNLYVLFLSALLKFSQFCWTFQRTNFCFINLLYFLLLLTSTLILIISFLLLLLSLFSYYCCFLVSWSRSLGYWFEACPQLTSAFFHQCYKFLSQDCFSWVSHILICCIFIWIQLNVLCISFETSSSTSGLFRNILCCF